MQQVIFDALVAAAALCAGSSVNYENFNGLPSKDVCTATGRGMHFFVAAYYSDEVSLDISTLRRCCLTLTIL
ncbi:hypothetical protein [Bradyrhizobium sp. CCGUVB14]|uniref:hypothetical protein n=1 Tax=Bradyrhizobium sp. CCGUVB14 TaxID=2949628 RepID=UPI0020B1F778|nr:hypothetical protein [Bradyrhizobium sp. CCGUVB14]MCP3442079.1 hypothetical protein [Bradyrhizobium sp. CCGUVB14]